MRNKKATIVVATVEGDIHDIGKNLVVLMLKNYGYNVIDLGKDVPASLIVETALKEHAKSNWSVSPYDNNDDAHERRCGIGKRNGMRQQDRYRWCGDQ